MSQELYFELLENGLYEMAEELKAVCSEDEEYLLNSVRENSKYLSVD